MKRAIMLAAVCATWLAAAPGSVLAHARLEKSDPPRRAALETSPRAIRLWFNEAVEAEFSRVTLVDASGGPVAEASRVDEENPKLLVLDLPEALAAGEYTVTFEVLSVDGHRVKESFAFTVKAAARAEE